MATPTMRHCKPALLTLATILSAAAPAAAQSLTPYNVFVFQDFTHTDSETDGRIAIGGNAFMTSWGVGRYLPQGYPDLSFVVAGNLNSYEGSVINGRTYVGGTVNATRTGFASPVESGTSPVDFASERARLTGISDGYAGMATTGSTSITAANSSSSAARASTSSA